MVQPFVVGSLFVAFATGMAGFVFAQQAPDLRPARDVLAQAVADGAALGIVVHVARGGDVLLAEALGHRDVDRKQLIERGTLFRMASNTKAVTAAAVLLLVADGKVGLDDPAARWLPGFATGDAAKITVRHLLTHTSGLRIPTLFVEPLERRSVEHPDRPNLVREASRFGEVGPKHPPGTTYSYSNPGYNALAAIVEVAGEKPFADFVAERLCRPLGLTNTCFHETAADHHRMSAVVAWQKDGGFRPVWLPGGSPTAPFVRGSGGMITTADEFARFCRLWLDRGVVGDVRVLPADLVQQATTNRIAHLDGKSYGFGWVAEPDGVFSHGGSDGTFAWCDPRRDLGGLVLTQTQSSPGLEKARQRFRELVEQAVPVGEAR